MSARAGARDLRVLQLLPGLHVGGVERGVLELDAALAAAGHSSLVASTGGPLAAGLKGVHLRIGSLARRDPFSVLLVNPCLLVGWMRTHRVRTLHAHSRSTALSALIACRFVSSARLVVTWHGMYSARSWWRRALNGVLLRAHRCILPSHTVHRHVSSVYPKHASAFRAERWRVVHRGVAAEAWNAPPVHGGELRASATVLLPARISSTKGQDTFVAALQALGRPGVKGVCIGGRAGARRGRYRQQLDDAVAKAQQHCALDISLVTHTDQIASHYHSADVVVVPSRRPEAFGRVLAEAAAAGRLVVAFLHGAVGELAAKLWRHGSGWPQPVELQQPGVLLLGSVFLVAPGDVTGLARAIGAALDMPRAERHRRVQVARKAVSECLSLDAFAEQTLRVYAECDAEIPAR